MSDCGEPSSKKRKRIYCVDGKVCSATWYYKVKKSRRLEAEFHNNDDDNTQLAEGQFQRLENLAKVQKEFEVADHMQKVTYDWLQDALISLSSAGDAASLGADLSSANDSFFCEANFIQSKPEPLNGEQNDVTVQSQPSNDEQNDVTVESEVFMQPTTSNFHQKPEPEDMVTRALTHLYGIFVSGGTPLAIQRLLLEFMRDLTPEVIQALPVDGRTLRPPRITFIRREMPPGEFVYFSIQKILALPGVELFDKELNEVRLSLGIDGVPVYKEANGIGFWPILGSIDKYPIFLIGLYSGVAKPDCCNCFLRELASEINYLCLKGLHVDEKTYKFRLWNIIMDAPAKAYILGVKSHGGYNSCQKCSARGEKVKLLGVDKNGRSKFGVRLLDVSAPACEHKEYVDYFNLHADPHDEANKSDNESQNSKSIQENRKKKNKNVKNKKDAHHLHPTLVSTLLHFNIIFGVPLDYMHLICLGIMKLLFFKWAQLGSKLYNTVLINKRLVNARKHCPREFQRKAQGLGKLCDWKATQFRMFLLYIGVVVLHGALENNYLCHFYVLVIAIRSMCRRVDQNSKRQEIMSSVANVCSKLLKYFVTLGAVLYSKTFVVHNVHSVIHIPDDYCRFGPLDEFSAFKYENFLGRVKKLVTASFQPMMQVINKYPSLLLNIGSKRGTNHIEEFYEIPKLRLPEKKKKRKKEEEKNNNQNLDKYEYFREMRFKNFVLRSDREGDRHVLMGTNTYVRIEKILQDRYTDEIFIAGKVYSEVHSLFSISEPCSFDSQDVGIVRAKLSNQIGKYKLCQLNEKCFALPLYPENKDLVNYEEEWTLIQFLH